MSLRHHGKHGHHGLPTADPYLVDHGDPSWSVRHYDLDLRYDLERNQLRGRATLSCVALDDDVTRVVLDLAGLDVEKLTLDGRSPAKYAARGTRVVVTPEHHLTAGQEFTLVIGYQGKPEPLIDPHHEDAGWEELTDGVIVAGQPHGAPTWFPCNDRPDDKSTYRIRVAVPPEYTVVSNGLLTGRERASGSVTWTYEQRQPMSTYLATVQIGRYDVRELSAGDGDAPPVLAAVPQGAGSGFDDAFGRTPEMIEVFTRLFGPYPFDTYAVVVTADDLEIPLESASLATFGANFMTGDWDCVRLVAHELAHQWFGNAVTLRRWQDIWLHEGFACYAEWLWSENSGGESADAHARRHHARLADLDRDLVLADPTPALMFDDRVYKRGALTLHALRLTVGDEAFFELLRAWVAEHDGGSVTTEDFLAHVAGGGHDVEDLLTPWLRDTALPSLP